ncbi:MAG: ATP synthase A1 subunit C [bacterium]|nr:ATP synthase A1 subunit C [bacterium]
MRSELLKKEEYHKLMKMKLNEIIEFLQESQYKKEINELAMNFSGVELMEMALNRNLTNTLAKLKRVSKKSLSDVISVYLKRLDVWNIKTIIRGKYVKAEEKKIESMLLPAGAIPKEQLLNLIKKETVEEVLKNCTVIPFAKLEKAYKSFEETKNLAEIENALDHLYYESVTKSLTTLPKDGRLFAEFLKTEVETLNILTLLRLKRAGVDKEKIKQHILSVRGSQIMKELIEAKDAETIISQLEKTKYGEHVKKGAADYKEKDTLIKIELELHKNLLRKSLLLLHQHPLSVEVILGFMFAKEIEVKNLKTLIKGKQLGLDDGFIEEQMVV